MSIKNKKKFVYIVENISIVSWIVYIFPFLIQKFFIDKQEIQMMYYIDGSKAGIALARSTVRIFRAHIEQLKFKLVDVKDEKNDLCWSNVFSKEVFALQNKVRNSLIYQRVTKKFETEGRMSKYLFRKVFEIDPTVSNLRLARLLLIVDVIILKIKESGQPCLIINNTLWFNEIRSFVESKGLDIVMLEKVNLKVFLFEFLRKPIFKRCYYAIIYYARMTNIFINSRKKFFLSKSLLQGNRLIEKDLSNYGPKLAVEYYGSLNLDASELHSDLFFWQTSNLSAKDIVIYFHLSQAPIDRKKLQEIQKHKMHPVALNLKAVATPGVSISKFKKCRSKERVPRGGTFEERWLNERISGYKSEFEYWKDIFIQNNVKLFISWYRFDANHIVIADALKAVGGAGVIYQRSLDGVPSPWYSMTTDIVFGYSPLSMLIEKDLNSTIPYFVVSGYLGDHRFALLKEHSQNIRSSLMRHGSKRIVAYFDENSCKDARWHLSHDSESKAYLFLLEKVLEDSSFGLILKPKNPSSLRKRLGSVVEKLIEAQRTGRCFVYENGIICGDYPPAAAALSADIAIHGQLSAGTAGVEAALAGIPTLLLDSEGWSMSSLYKLKEGQVIFKSWDHLWRACEEYWKAPEGIPGFGDWSSILDQIDPFRDGRAAERMGTYLVWLMEGFKANLPRETVLADAAERYTKIWGKDKVFSVNCEVRNVIEAV